METEEKFRLGREIISHENELVNHRMTWLLLLTGFLFSAFFALIGSADKVIQNLGKYYLFGAALSIASAGIYAAISAAVLISQAHKQIGKVAEWWEKVTDDLAHFPQISAEPDKRLWRRIVTTTGLACFMAVLWALVLLLTLAFLVLHQAPAAPPPARQPGAAAVPPP